MNLSVFDLHWDQNSLKHWIESFYFISFDEEKISFIKSEQKILSKNELNYFLNNSDFNACHNFFWFDWAKLPGLKSHFEKNIDTLLIDCLFNFDKESHKLFKSNKNNTLEDVKNTFKILENNIIFFDKLDSNLKNIFHQLLKNEKKYKDFFMFYKKLVDFTFDEENDIFENINYFLLKKWLKSEKALKIIKSYLENKKFLEIAYLIIFLEKGKINLANFISKNNIEFRVKLKNLLSDIFPILSEEFSQRKNFYLKEFSNFDNFRWEVQSLWVDFSLKQKNFLSILSTWWWKSLIYQLPAYVTWKYLWDLTLVITPLKALIKDQIDWLQNKWLNFVEKFSWEQSSLEKDIIKTRIKSGETKILFLTPESLRSESVLDLLKNRFVSRIVVDEAHTLILWWQEFRPDYFFIKYFLKDLEKVWLNKNISLTLLTATATIDVEKWILKYFSDKKIEIIKNKDILKENILGSVVRTKNKVEKEALLLKKISEININKNPTIIFTALRRTTEELQNLLKESWIKSEAFHAWIKENAKKEIQRKFISGEINLIICTKAFGMWIDKENVRFVIHYDLPWNIEDYTQEIWRAWRDGKLSQNIIFYNKEEIKKRKKEIKNSWLKYFQVWNFLKRILENKNFKEKMTLSPRDIAMKSWILLEKENWKTDVKLLLNFLEQETIGGKKILSRKYDNNLVIFDKIENNIVQECYGEIEKDNYLNNQEKLITKEIVYKIVDQKLSIDLNNLEENFSQDIWDTKEKINFSKISMSKIVKKIGKFKILSKSEKENKEIILEATTLMGNKYRRENYNIYKNIILNIDKYKEKDLGFYKSIKKYYSEKNLFKDKNLMLKHFEEFYQIWEIILKNIFNDFKDLNNKKNIDLKKLLIFMQEKYSQDFSISKLKEVLYFLHNLNFIRIKNWILVFLNRFNIYFDKEILESKESFKKYLSSLEFIEEVRDKLELFREIKLLKIEALEKIVETLEQKWFSEYTNLTNYYFNSPLLEFKKEFLNKKSSI